MAEQYTWEWLAQRVDPELIPAAKKFVANPGAGIYWGRTWSEGRETTPEQENFKGLCSYFDPKCIGEENAQNQKQMTDSLISMLIDSLGSKAYNLLKALAMVEIGLWKEVPAFYHDEQKLNLLEDYALVKKQDGRYVIICQSLQKHCFLRGRFVWGDGPYVEQNDPNHPTFFTSRGIP